MQHPTCSLISRCLLAGVRFMPGSQLRRPAGQGVVLTPVAASTCIVPLLLLDLALDGSCTSCPGQDFLQPAVPEVRWMCCSVPASLKWSSRAAAVPCAPGSRTQIRQSFWTTTKCPCLTLPLAAADWPSQAARQAARQPCPCQAPYVCPQRHVGRLCVYSN